MNILTVRASEIECVWTGILSDLIGAHQWCVVVKLRSGNSTTIRYEGDNAKDNAAKDVDRIAEAMRGDGEDIVQAGWL